MVKVVNSDQKVDVPIERKQKKSPEALKDWNQKTRESYTKQGFTIPDRLDEQEGYFLQRVDAEKYSVEKEVAHIFRIQAKDYNSPKHELKEYVYWWENGYGKNWLGQKVPPVTNHVEGKYMEQESEPVVYRQEVIGHNRTGQHEVHYVLFSKKAVEDIIAKSTFDNKHEIHSYIKTPKQRNGEYTYEQFVNGTFDQCVEMMEFTGGPSMFEYHKQQQLKKDAEQLKQQEQYTQFFYYYLLERSDINSCLQFIV